MKGILSFFVGLSVLILVICLAGWIFSTGFFIFEVLFMFAICYALPILGGLVVLVILVWIFNEIFR
jgi:hypothetical protein